MRRTSLSGKTGATVGVIGLALLSVLGGSMAQEEAAPAATATPGPVVTDFGAVYDVPAAADLGRRTKGFKAIFDVAASPEDPAALNRRIETAARFLNMHARAGYSRHRNRAVIVLHGAAAKDALSDAAYQERHGTDNPNSALLAALREAGVEIYLCGQSAAYNGYAPEDLNGSVELSLSAMTALIEYQSLGYGLIAF